jgi:chlorobactene glucosyltransferase
MLIYQSIVTAIIVLLLLNTINNLRVLRKPAKRPPPDEGPLVSVLVPARNEARSIGRCVESLARQDYPHLEILVLDDHSEDETAAIVEDLARRYPAVRLLRGQPLPPHWHGKAYACAQLAREARGAWLLFVDADAMLAPACVSTTLQIAREQDAGLLTMMPLVLEQSFGEALLLPLIVLTFGAFLPMGLVVSRKYPLVAGALGPFLLFRRETYERVGGHEATRRDIVEDMKLALLVKQSGNRLVWVDGTTLAQVRFYHNLREAWRGFAKTTFAALNYSVPTLLLGLIPCIAIFLAPYAFLLSGLLSQRFSLALFWLPLSQILLTWTFRLLLARRFHMRYPMLFLHAVTMLLTILLTLHAAYQAMFGAGVAWKGRAYQFQPRRARASARQRLIHALPAIRLVLACLLALLGWRWKAAALGVAAFLPLISWTCAMLGHALATSPETTSSVTLANVADGANGLASLTYLLLSELMTPWMALTALIILLISACCFHWRSLPMAASITLGSLLLLIGGANLSLIRIALIWWVVGAIFLSRRSVGQFLGAWFQRLRPPL